MAVDAFSLLPIILLAIQAGLLIDQGFEAYKAHNEIISNVCLDVAAFQRILESLKTLAPSDLQTSKLLEVPLKQYVRIAQDLSKLIQKCNGRSKNGRTSLRDNALLQYHMEDIVKYRRSLEEYKSTITVAVLMIAARKQDLSIETLQEHGALIATCMPRLEQRLQEIDKKLRELSDFGDESPIGCGEDSLQILEDQASMLECINICRQAQQEINNHIRLLTRGENEHSKIGGTAAESVIQKPTLQGWRDQFDAVAVHLENRPLSSHVRKDNKASRSRHSQRLELEHDQKSVQGQMALYQEFSRVVEQGGMVFHDVSAAASGFQSITSNPGQGVVANRVHGGARALQMFGAASNGDLSSALEAFVAINRSSALDWSSRLYEAVLGVKMEAISVLSIIAQAVGVVQTLSSLGKDLSDTTRGLE